MLSQPSAEIRPLLPVLPLLLAQSLRAKDIVRSDITSGKLHDAINIYIK